jgi:hypothetical protein
MAEPSVIVCLQHKVIQSCCGGHRNPYNVLYSSIGFILEYSLSPHTATTEVGLKDEQREWIHPVHDLYRFKLCYLKVKNMKPHPIKFLALTSAAFVKMIYLIICQRHIFQMEHM